MENIINFLSEIEEKNNPNHKKNNNDNKFIITEEGDLVLNTKNKEVINQFNENIRKLKDKK